LAEGRYTGLDPLGELIDVGRRLCRDARLAEKNPTIDVLEAFPRFAPRSFDFVLTQSVLNHLNLSQIRKTIARVGQAMARDGRWVATAAFSNDVATSQQMSHNNDYVNLAVLR
jgi:hypothetical protein